MCYIYRRKKPTQAIIKYFYWRKLPVVLKWNRKKSDFVKAYLILRVFYFNRYNKEK